MNKNDLTISDFIAVLSFLGITFKIIIKFLSDILEGFKNAVSPLVVYLDGVFFSGFTVCASIFLIYYYFDKRKRRELMKRINQEEMNEEAWKYE